MEFLKWWSSLSSDFAFGVGLLILLLVAVAGSVACRLVLAAERIFGRHK